MIPQERRKQILSLLSSHGYMTVVLLMDHTKMGEANYYTAFAFSEIDILVTDCPLPPEIADRCARENIAVITPKSRNGF